MFEQLAQAAAAGNVAATLRAVFEVALLSYVFYQLIRAIRGTRAAPMVFAVGLLVASYYASGLLGLHAIHMLLSELAPYAVIAVVIVFQPEIRATLRDLALHLAPSTRSSTKVYYEYEDVVFALHQLSQSKVGALIVIERETGMRTFVQSGVALEARLSSDLLVSIFQRSSPLHDGGVIIQGERVAAAACFLPLTTNPGLVASLGTRHRAAIGITEESDAVALVVSETDGRMSIAFSGDIELGVTIDRIRLRMIQYLGPVVSAPKGNPVPPSGTASSSGPEPVPMEVVDVEARELH